MHRVASAGVAVAIALLVAAPAAQAAPGEIAEFAIATSSSLPQGIALGTDGALWFAERSANAIGRIAADGTSTEFPLPTAAAQPFWVAAGSDGNIWFTERSGNQIGRLTPAGAVTEFAVPTAASLPAGIAAGPDGALWFAEQSGNKIGRIATDGTITEFATPTRLSGPYGITVGPDGALWFTEQTANKLGRITTSGAVTEVGVTPSNRLLSGITAGPDGNVWFAERSGQAVGYVTPDMSSVSTFGLATSGNPVGIAAGSDGNLWFTENGGNKIASITTDGTITEYALPNANSQPFGIVAGPDGMWFTEQAGNRIGRMSMVTDTTAPTISIASPADSAWYLTGDLATAEYSCADEEGGSGLATCVGPVANGDPIDTSVGPHTFTVNASDVSGNSSSLTHSYSVFAGMGGPLGKSRAQHAGRALPAWLDLGSGGTATTHGHGQGHADAGNPHRDGMLGADPIVQQVSCDETRATLGDPTPAAVKTHPDGTGRLHLVWKTQKDWAGTCQALTLAFAAWDGATATFVVTFG